MILLGPEALFEARELMASSTSDVSVIESSSALQKAVQALQEAAKVAQNLKLIRQFSTSKATGILWKIIKGLCSNMSWYDWVKTAGTVIAMIVADVRTGGVALIARIILALNSDSQILQLRAKYLAVYMLYIGNADWP